MNNKGFTFVEILAVIVLIGILSSIAIIGVSRYRENAKNKDYEALAKSSYSAMEEYMMKHPYKKEVSLETLENGSFLSNRKDPGTKTTDCSGSVEVKMVTEGKNGSMDENNYIVYLCCTNYKKKYTYPEGKVEEYTGNDKCDYTDPEPDDTPPPPPTPGTTSYTLHYNDNGGSGCSSKTITRNAGESWGTLCTPTRSGYKFDGWKNGDTIVNASSKANANITVKAEWTSTSPTTYTCAAGKYLPANKTSCDTCTAGNYCKGGTWKKSTSNQGLTKCPSGYANSAAGSKKDVDCYRKVPGGYYLAKKNATSDTKCPAGKYKQAHNVNYGSTSSCANCPSGFGNSNAGSTKPESCYKTVTATFNFNISKYQNLTIEHTGHFKNSSKSCNYYYNSSGCAVSTPKCRFGTSGNSKDVDMNKLFTCKFGGVVAGNNLSIKDTKTYTVSVSANSSYVNKTSKTYALSGSGYYFTVVRDSQSELYNKGAVKATNKGNILDNHPFKWDGQWMVDSKKKYIWLHITTVNKESLCTSVKDSQNCRTSTQKKFSGWMYYKLMYYK